MLICDECGETSEDAEGWKAIKLNGEYEFGLLEPDEIALFCPRCWSREFAES